MTRADRIRAELERLAAQAPDLAECVRGSVVERRTRCGKPTCACARDDDRRHGPYHYLLVTMGPSHTKTVFIPAHLVGRVRRWSANYARLRRVVEQVTEANCALIEQERGKERGHRGR